jgi:hypothetical protein
MAKMKQKSMPPSTSQPATMVGEHLHMDLNVLTVASPGGRSVSIRSKDDVSGDEQIHTIPSKSAKPVFDGICTLIHLRYSKHGHRTRLISVDTDPAFEAVIPMLAAIGINLALMDPGSHEHFLENSVGSTAGRMRAVFSSLPWILPAQYMAYLERWVMDNSNAMPNSRSRPSTPDVLVTGCRRVPHYKTPIAFGATCMVQQGHQKRVQQGKAYDILPSMVNKAEPGVCLGYSPECAGDYLFLLDNGQIVPRRVFQRVDFLPTLKGVHFKSQSARLIQPLLPTPDPLRDLPVPVVFPLFDFSVVPPLPAALSPAMVQSPFDPLPISVSAWRSTRPIRQHFSTPKHQSQVL